MKTVIWFHILNNVVSAQTYPIRHIKLIRRTDSLVETTLCPLVCLSSDPRLVRIISDCPISIDQGLSGARLGQFQMSYRLSNGKPEREYDMVIIDEDDFDLMFRRFIRLYIRSEIRGGRMDKVTPSGFTRLVDEFVEAVKKAVPPPKVTATRVSTESHGVYNMLSPTDQKVADEMYEQLLKDECVHDLNDVSTVVWALTAIVAGGMTDAILKGFPSHRVSGFDYYIVLQNILIRIRNRVGDIKSVKDICAMTVIVLREETQDIANNLNIQDAALVSPTISLFPGMPKKPDQVPLHPGTYVVEEIIRRYYVSIYDVMDKLSITDESTAIAPSDYEGRDGTYFRDLIDGREPITPQLAIRLEETYPDLRTALDWMRLQAEYDLWKLRNR